VFFVVLRVGMVLTIFTILIFVFTSLRIVPLLWDRDLTYLYAL
jgi:uncharacterized membrane protein